tara:strand:+ start:347 stop:931 length:585 start_codon:yes stop_codon:yes gene_type:complete
MKSKAVLLFCALFSTTSVIATSPNWDYVQGGYYTADVSDFDGFDPTGFGVGGAKSLGDNVFVRGSYSMLSDDLSDGDVDFDQGSAELGYRYKMSSSTDVYGTIAYQYAELSIDAEGSDASTDTDGFGATIGIRSMVTNKIDLEAAAGFLRFDGDSEAITSITANYFFHSDVSAGINFTKISDVSTLGAVLRYSF